MASKRTRDRSGAAPATTQSLTAIADRQAAARAIADSGWRKVKTLGMPIRFAEDAADARLSDQAFRLHVVATLWSSKYGFRESIDQSDVTRCFYGASAGDASSAAAELVSAGFWEDLGNGEWLIVYDLVPEREPQPQDDPNRDDGTWGGVAHLDVGDHCPAPGVSVVYHLLDDDGLCYIGSSLDLRTRLAAHRWDGKPFTWWTAKRCVTRQAAFAQEWAEISKHRPRLNRLMPNSR